MAQKFVTKSQLQNGQPPSRKRASKLDVAREYNVSPRTVDYWIQQHKIPYRKFGPRLLQFDLDQVERALDRYTIKEVQP
jgi:hypothetical protein